VNMGHVAVLTERLRALANNEGAPSMLVWPEDAAALLTELDQLREALSYIERCSPADSHIENVARQALL
jgi:hypothetical protein